MMKLIARLLSFLTGLIVSSLLNTGCGSTPKSTVDVPVSDEPVIYKVRERYPDPAPEWTRDFHTYEKREAGRGLRHYLGESGDVSDRIAGCDLADLDGRRKIAQQIATLITDKIASSKAGQLVIDRDNPNDPELRRHFESTVAAKSMAFLTGIRTDSQYWEERDYSISGGRKRVYLCRSVVTIADRDFEAALKRTVQKAPEVSDDPDTKAAVKDALKGVEEQFKSFSGH